MKNSIKNIGLALMALLAFSFTVVGTKKDVKVSQSKVVWKAYKVTGSHTGTIDLKSGSLSFNGDQLNGGEFTVAMSTINVTDITADKGKGKLEGHLKSADFFDTTAYPEANIVFKKVTPKGKNSYTVKADLKIKDKTNPVTFDISIYGTKATASLKIDRTEFGVQYASANFFKGLADKAIYDEFDLVVDLEF